MQLFYRHILTNKEMTESNIYIYANSLKITNDVEYRQTEKLRTVLKTKLFAIDAENDFDKTVTHIHVVFPFDAKNIATLANFVVNEENKNQVMILYNCSNYFTDFVIALRGKVDLKNVKSVMEIDEIVRIIEGLMI